MLFLNKIDFSNVVEYLLRLFFYPEMKDASTQTLVIENYI
jgi:hypothetical protein